MATQAKSERLDSKTGCLEGEAYEKEGNPNCCGRGVPDHRFAVGPTGLAYGAACDASAGYQSSRDKSAMTRQRAGYRPQDKAHLLGRVARLEGRARAECPYGTEDSNGGRNSFMKVFRKKWIEGYESNQPVSDQEHAKLNGSVYDARVQALREKGRLAREQGATESACKYRSFYRNEWLRGYRSGPASQGDSDSGRRALC